MILHDSVNFEYRISWFTIGLEDKIEKERIIDSYVTMTINFSSLQRFDT